MIYDLPLFFPSLSDGQPGKVVPGYSAELSLCSQPAQERAKVDLLLQTVHEIAFESAAAKESAIRGTHEA